MLHKIVCMLSTCSLLGVCLLILAILADSFLELLEETLPPLIHRVIFLQELDTNSTSQLQEDKQDPVSRQTNCIKVPTLT